MRKTLGDIVMDDPIERFIRAHPPEIEAITRDLRAMVKVITPAAYEMIYHGALSYSLGPSAYERLVHLALEKRYVRLGFNFGRYLADPQLLLTGEGRRLRHVKVYSVEQTNLPAIRMLVQAARDVGKVQVAEMKIERSR